MKNTNKFLSLHFLQPKIEAEDRENKAKLHRCRKCNSKKATTADYPKEKNVGKSPLPDLTSIAWCAPLVFFIPLL